MLGESHYTDREQAVVRRLNSKLKNDQLTGSGYMKIKDKRKAGEILEREGIAQRIIKIATEISNGGYKDAMQNAGRIAELVDCSTYDNYWEQKASLGKQYEQGVLLGLIEGDISKESAINCVRPREVN